MNELTCDKYWFWNFPVIEVCLICIITSDRCNVIITLYIYIYIYIYIVKLKPISTDACIFWCFVRLLLFLSGEVLLTFNKRLKKVSRRFWNILQFDISCFLLTYFLNTEAILSMISKVGNGGRDQPKGSLFLESLSSFAPIIHHSWQVFHTLSCICSELM